MSVQTERAFLYGRKDAKTTSGSFKEEYCDDGEIRYFVEWDITNRLDEWVSKKLKDTLDIDEDRYDTIDTFEGFCSSDREEANEFYNDLNKIIGEQYDYWDSHSN
tara:strand:- start:1663 stop:1977 length:315 start_codon:yes stop_codon:yes gene_type:complete